MLSVSFKGCEKPYYMGGTKIIPIAKNPSAQEIKEAKESAIPPQLIGAGLNCAAFTMGQDLVVKKYTNEEAAQREIQKLDELYDKHLTIPNVQSGEYAFINDEGTYLVSKMIRGTTPDCVTNPFNKENLSSLANILYEMDKPVKTSESNGNFPYAVMMHYDLHDGNINVTDSEAGILDLEYLTLKDISDFKKSYDCDCNFSDISGIPSNLRGFEYRTLVPYLLNMQKQNPEGANKLFEEYLNIKSYYHARRSRDFHNNSLDTGYAINQDLAKKEAAHAEMLYNASPDVIAAEKIKIQLADFIFIQGPCEGATSRKFNKEQVVEYVDKANQFFNKKAAQARTANESIYWEDCLNLLRNWQDVKQWMNWQDSILPIEAFNYEEIPEEEMTQKQKEKIQSRYEKHLQDYELFQIKKSDQYQDVIFDINCLS